MSRQIAITCTPQMKTIICEALRLYAVLAFPDDCSPCQMVSREALQTAADEFERRYIETGTGYISRRMRAMVNAAIKTFYKVKAEQQGTAMNHECDLMLAVCKGGIKSDSDLALARKLDASDNEG